jgi:hypothetical protein
MAEIGSSDDAHALLIDAALPVWHWREYHQRLVRADLSSVWQACLTVTAGDLLITRPLMRLRGLGGPLSSDAAVIDNVPPRPIARHEPDEILLGLIFPTHGRLKTTPQPDSIAALISATGAGLVRQAVNLRLRPVAGGTLLSTETRAIATDDGARRRFALYWSLIRPASGLIRHDILRAIARHAERRAVVDA